MLDTAGHTQESEYGYRERILGPGCKGGEGNEKEELCWSGTMKQFDKWFEV